MRSTKRVVDGFRAFGETRQPVFLAQGADTVAPPCQDLVRIALVANVPDDLVLGGVKHRMQRNRQFDNTQTRAQVPAGFRHGRDSLGAQFMRDLRQFSIGELLQVFGFVYPVQKRCFGSGGHGCPFVFSFHAR